ncbi:ABC transporter ATP-binding protein, partial [Streptomyces sp. NPDC058953]
GGEPQWRALGGAPRPRPRLILLPSPSLGRAPLLSARIAEAVEEINAAGTSVLLVEQNAALALRLASRASVLEVGEVTLSGTASALAASDEVRRRYLGVVDEDAAADTAGAAVGRPVLRRWSA